MLLCVSRLTVITQEGKLAYVPPKAYSQYSKGSNGTGSGTGEALTREENEMSASKQCNIDVKESNKNMMA